MRGQITIEWLMDFMLVLVMVAFMLTVLQGIEGETRAQKELQQLTFELEEEARAVDILSNSFSHAYVEVEGVYRIDQNRLLQENRGDWVEIKTLYGGEYEKEPV